MMKRTAKMNSICLATLAFALSIGTFSMRNLTTSAGIKQIQTNYQTDENNLSAWETTEDIVAASDSNKIVFSDSSNADSKVIGKNKFTSIAKADELLRMEAEIKILSLAVDTRFGAVFGLSYYVDGLSDGECTFAYFKTEGTNDLTFGLSIREEDGEVTLVEKEKVATLGESFSFVYSIDGDKKASVKINDVTMCANVVNVTYTDGYCGFAQTGVSHTEISSLKIQGYVNDTPSNVDFSEGFDYGEFNAELLYTYAKVGTDNPQGRIVVQDKKLRFQDVATGYVSTRYQYSNVSMSFDLYLENREYTDSNGVCRKDVSSGFKILFGAERYKNTAKTPVEISFERQEENSLAYDYETKIVLSGSSIGEKQTVICPKNVNIFNRVTDECVNVWVTATDGTIEVFLKYQSDRFYTRAATFETDGAKLGYVQLFSCGTVNDGFCNFLLDNLALTNLDGNRRTGKYSYTTNVWDMSDFEYEDKWDDSDLIG